MDKFINVPKQYGVEAVDTEPLAAFFAKPHVVATGEITTATSDIFNFDIGPQILSNTRWANKMAGYALCRGTAVVRITVNAQPFQQGRLIMSCLPFSNRFSTFYRAMRTTSLTSLTQLPNVELDFRDTTAELRIPYVTPVQWYSPYSAPNLNWDWGNIFVRMMSSLQTGSSTPNCSYTIWLSFEDMEFSMPVVPQAKSRSSRKKDRVIKIGSTETEHMQSKPISEALSKVSSVAQILEGVPLLSSIAAPVSWAARIASNLASAFGFSKPLNDSIVTYVASRAYRGYTNAEGTSNAEPLSLVSRPEIQVLPGFAGTDLDEMSFDYLKTIPAYTTRFTWNVTGVTSDLLYTSGVGPIFASNLETLPSFAGTYKAYYAPPFGHLSNYFKYYRGSIRMHLKIVKTDFHSGRLQITYTPNLSGRTNTTDSNVQDAQYALRDIVDIRERSEIVFEFPYLANTNYLERPEQIGRVNIRILNELRAPATAAQNVEVLVYYSAGDDFELAVPMPTNYHPITPQSGLDSSTIQTAKASANLKTHFLTSDFSTTSIGDSFTSVKQLILRYSRIAYATINTGVPSGVQAWWFANDGTTPNTSDYGHDLMSAMSGGYMLARGSLRYIISPCPTTAQPSTSATVMLGNNFLGTVQGVDTNFQGFNPSSTTLLGGSEVVFQDSAGGVEVQVPYFNKTLASQVKYDYGLLSTNDSLPNLRLSWGFAANTKHFIARSAGDDFQFGYFVGFAPYNFGFTPL